MWKAKELRDFIIGTFLARRKSLGTFLPLPDARRISFGPWNSPSTVSRLSGLESDNVVEMKKKKKKKKKKREKRILRSHHDTAHHQSGKVIVTWRVLGLG